MAFTTIAKRVVNWDVGEPEIVSKPAPVIPAVVRPAVPVTAETSSLRLGQTDKNLVAEPRQKITRNRTGNGHTSEFVRKLKDPERNFFRSAFMGKDGLIQEDDCNVLLSGVDDEITIWQVTGFISYLHRQVAQGLIQLRNLPAYLEWMQTKYEGLWTQYNSNRFTSVRVVNEQSRRRGEPATVSIPIEEVPIRPAYARPNFKAFPRRGSYSRG